MDTPPRETTPPAATEPARSRTDRYVPQVLKARLASGASSRAWVTEGTAVFVDVTGFTRLSEQLASRGREGAEQITDVIGDCFGAILAVAADVGGSLVKFGGDALLLWFEGPSHLARGCAAAVRMRERFAEVGRIELPGASIVLQVSQGLHSGTFHFFAVGATHVELLPAGPGWTRLVAMERAAGADEILLSDEAAAGCPPEILGEARAGGRLLSAAPEAPHPFAPEAPVTLAPEQLAHCLAPVLRAHAEAGGGGSEHRVVAIAFIRYEGLDALSAGDGAEAAATALERIVSTVDAICEARGVALLGSDVDADGGKLILVAGAPRVTGDDEERILLAARALVDAKLPLPLRIGVHRGPVFAGDIGPETRKTYTVMGDAVNLAARLMHQAAPGEVLATADVLDRSNTRFASDELAPFAVKGKAEPVRAWRVGAASGSRARQGAEQRLPLTGRNTEMGLLRKALGAARGGANAWVEIVANAGVGKTRLLEALGDAAMGFRKLSASCEAYTSDAPYAAWRDVLRTVLDIDRDSPDATVEARLRDAIDEKAPELAPWTPLAGAVFGVELPATPEVAMLAEKNRRGKLHEVVARLLDACLPGPAVIAIDDVHHMDEASAEFTAFLARSPSARPWLLALARRPGAEGFVLAEGAAATRIELKPLAAADARRMADLASKDHPLPAHVLDVVAQRSGGNPQFLRDLMRSAQSSGSAAGLPDSAESAAMARIDALAPDDRALVRRASVFGMAFHPRMLRWLDGIGEGAAPGDEAWTRLADIFEDDGHGYLRFHHAMLRDSAYEGLPFRLRRQMHAAVAARIEEEADDPEDAAGILSIHYLVAGDYAATRRYAALAAHRAEVAYAYVDAAALHGRAMEAGRQLPDLPPGELARTSEAMADAWNRAGEYRKAAEAYAGALKLAAGDALVEAGLLLKQSWLEEKLGKYPEALRWLDRARESLGAASGPEAARLGARTSAWTATILQAQGRTSDAVTWAERTMAEARAADDPEALGTAHFVLGWAAGVLGKTGGEAMLKDAVEAFVRSGNRVRQAATLSNLGVICQWEGRWDDAMAYYERGRDESLKVGNRVDAAVSRINVAEILIDRGEVPEAEKMLLETMPLWKSSEYRYFLGATLWMLGRASLRANRVDEAIERLGQARDHLAHVGAEQEILDVDARLAECHVLKGRADEALAIADRLLGEHGDDEGVARLRPLLQRARGHALMLQFDPYAAREALEASLATARERRDAYESAVTLASLIELDRLEGVEAPTEIVDESRALLAKFKVRSLPPMPAFG